MNEENSTPITSSILPKNQKVSVAKKIMKWLLIYVIVNSFLKLFIMR